jgi:hypothetical protein
VPAIELDSHRASAHSKTACTLLHAAFGYLLYLIDSILAVRVGFGPARR